jgi:uncharacterized glyoxalase superfamily metalloenzyme YdcJ
MYATGLPGYSTLADATAMTQEKAITAKVQLNEKEARVNRCPLRTNDSMIGGP